jgi:hypothetical protein
LPEKTYGSGGGPLTAPLTGTPASPCEPLSRTDPELTRVVTVWPDLPPHIKAAVLALIATTG